MIANKHKPILNNTISRVRAGCRVLFSPLLIILGCVKASTRVNKTRVKKARNNQVPKLLSAGEA